MKRITAVLLCVILLANSLSGCSYGEEVQAKNMPSEDVLAGQMKPTDAEDIENEEKDTEDEQIDKALAAVRGESGDIDYSSVKNLQLEAGSHIAVVVKSAKTGYWATVQKGMEAAVAELNEELGYKGNDKIYFTYEGSTQEDDVETQINIIDAVLSENPAVLCLAAIDMDSCGAQLETAAENGIPVIALDSGVNSDILQTICSTDNYQAGVEAARRLCTAIGDNGEVAAIAHNLHSQSSEEREQGFREEIADNHPNVTIVDVSYENEEESVKDMVETVLTTYPNLAGYFCTSESVTSKLLESMMIYPDKMIAIVGFDAGKEQISAIREGTEVGSVVQNSYGMGYATIVAAVRAASGLLNDTCINSGYQWVDKENIENPEYENYLYE